MKPSKSILKILALMLLVNSAMPQDDLKNLELLDDEDINVLLNDKELSQTLDLSRLEEIDDLESLKNDVGDGALEDTLSAESEEKLKEFKSAKKLEEEKEKMKAQEEGILTEDKKVGSIPGKIEIFDVGDEEKKLLELAKFVEKKIPNNEWDEIATAASIEKYVIQEGDWLWKISQKLFGSGFYYSKIWSMNPHITNPHEVEPGQVLVFDTGSSENFPKVQLGKFEESNVRDMKLLKGKRLALSGFDKYGEGTMSPWLEERQKLKDQGVYFQNITDASYEDIINMSGTLLNQEYKKYVPPETEIKIEEPDEKYDEDGIDRTSKLSYNVKEGFYLNTFLTTNYVQDLGEVAAKKDESLYVRKSEIIYVRFDKGVKVRPGDQFSLYSPGGKQSHPISDREGHKYSITAQIKVVRQIEDKWEAEVTDIAGLVERGTRITVYTPKINRIFQSFNKRRIEAAIISAYESKSGGISMGDVVYLDRGRVDGVELGNVFETFSFKDKGTGKRISNNPAYITGELVVITLTDNFSTALVINNSSAIEMGTVALSKTQEKAIRESRLKAGLKSKAMKKQEDLALEELDVELRLDDLGKDLLDKVDEIQINEDELEELERQEREKSVIKEHEKELKELERLEQELIDAQSKLNEKRVDEDEYLEKSDLELIENSKAKKANDPNAFASMDEIEAEFGKKYMDEDLNSRDNPYGLTEYDLEEIDELLNATP
jgi:hypothetical protein